MLQDLLFTAECFKLFIVTLHVFVTMLAPQEVSMHCIMMQ